MREFSFRTRLSAIERFGKEEFDLLVVGGGITGAAVARDAVMRGLRVALVEKRDFAWGTSSRSSKLIHGGLRYLQNFELGLVFEALAERAFLLKSVPHMVRPLPFYLPIYRGKGNSRPLLSVGLWLYDLLALFRTPGFHRYLSKKKVLEEIPFLNPEGLVGAFRYFDASMWDDVLAVETLRDASLRGAAVANYVEAVDPIWEDGQVRGYEVRDDVSKQKHRIHAKRVILCVGPWTDEVGPKLSPQWRRWLIPSKGIHLVFDLKRLPVPGATVMTHEEDGRIAFVIPRKDLGAGVVIVGTTDGPTPPHPEDAQVQEGDVSYLMDLLRVNFPQLNLTENDILSTYVGIRPLMGAPGSVSGSEGQGGGGNSQSLQKISREHYIGEGPGSVILVAGGKYTTHRTMAKEIVDFALDVWKKNKEKVGPLPKGLKKGDTRSPVNPEATEEEIEKVVRESASLKKTIPAPLLDRYGGEALDVLGKDHGEIPESPEGFPLLGAQLRHCMDTGMVVHLEDFYFRRIPLFLARKDHGLPWVEPLAKIWGEYLGKTPGEVAEEVVRLRETIDRRTYHH